MKVVDYLRRRAYQLNKRQVFEFEEAHVANDGHGTYLVRGKKFVEQVYVNKLQAGDAAKGKHNPNLDAMLRF